MKDDRFTNLEKDIIRTVGRVLSSQEMSDLKHTIYSAMNQVEKATRKTAEKLQDLGEEIPKKQTYQSYQPYKQTTNSSTTAVATIPIRLLRVTPITIPPHIVI